MINLAELEAKARAATQGWWSVEPHGSTRALYSGRHDVGHGLRLFNLDDGDRNIAANAAYIVAAQPSVVLKLIERIRAALASAAEPVAWEVHFSDGTLLTVTTKRHLAEDISGLVEGRTIRPLYAAPPDVSALQERVQVLEKALGKIEVACLSDDDGPDEIVEIVFGTATAALKGRWRQR